MDVNVNKDLMGLEESASEPSRESGKGYNVSPLHKISTKFPLTKRTQDANVQFRFPGRLELVYMSPGMLLRGGAGHEHNTVISCPVLLAPPAFAPR